ncbi:hypothetical protein [Actinocrispum sp. NPDC049592]|uniref:hypothetical protein n=1 Tax=Actinocrispum sp. NPDC049592 TaxID=3154835 RepID=UPI003449C17D
MGVRRVPNESLRELLSEARWTGEALARAVNTVAAEAGVTLRYRRSSVSHWLSGIRPRPPVPAFVAEALSRRLGRTVTVPETGLVKTSPPVRAAWHATDWWDGDPVGRLLDLSERAQQGREVLAECAYSLAALEVPDWVRLTAELPRQRSASRDGGRVGRGEVDAVTTMLAVFSSSDSMFGGRRGRDALMRYLGLPVASWLRADARPAVRRHLLVAVARLTYLCGFMNFDEQLHGIAQRYYSTSLMLAAEGGDVAGHALALRALSVQARTLGHYRQAVHLAEAAVRSAARRVNPQTRAFLLGQLAVAHAAAGDRYDAVINLGLAESELEQADVLPRLVGAFHGGSLAHQRAVVAACAGDRRGAITALEAASRQRPATERRSRAIVLARLAELQAASGQLELACRTWTQFLADCPQLYSARIDSALANLRALTRPHQRNASVRRLHEIAATLSHRRDQAASGINLDAMAR